MSNAFFVVSADLYDDLQDRRHLRRLADVLLGDKKPATIALAQSPALATLTLSGDAWEHLPRRLVPFESINGTSHGLYLGAKFATSFAHGALRPATWNRRGVLNWLGSFHGLVFDVVVAAARARGEAGGGATRHDGVARIKLDTAALYAAGYLRPPYVGGESVVAPDSLQTALAHVALYPGADVDLVQDLGALALLFTNAFVGSWTLGAAWSELPRNVIVRIPV